MRASEFITELFQPGKNWQWEFRGSEEVAAQFNVDKHAYRFHAFDDDGTWEVEFALSDNKDDDDRPLSSLGKYGLTGTGNAAEVMSIVADIMRSFLSEYDDKITALKFSANEPSRKALYLRMIKRLLPNWRVSPDEFDDNGFVVFRQRAKQALKQGVAEDSENYGGIQLSLEIQKDDEYVDDEDTDNQTIYVTATSNGRELGHVLFTIDYDSQGMVLNPQDLEVEERFRGQGIAQTMYDYVKSKGYRIRRSGQQTDAGAAFWDKHKPGKNVWEQGVAEEKQRLDPKCWTGYKKQGTKIKGGVRVNNCVPKD